MVFQMYQYAVPSAISEKDLTKLTKKLSKEEKCETTLLWVPYQTLECTTQTFEGKIEKTKTALNIMFPDEIFDEKDIILLFRPNFLKIKKKKYESINLGNLTRIVPERIADIRKIDYKRITEKIVSLSKNVYENLEELKFILINRQSIDTIQRLVLPSTDELSRLMSSEERKVKDFIERKFANAMALSTVIKMTLNIKNLPEKITFKEKEVFYYPYLVISTKNDFFFIDLVKRGRLSKKFIEDPILNRIMRENELAREIILKTLT